MKRPPIAFTGATALVTGAGRGIGRATAHALAAKGSTVLCTDIDEAAAARTAAECLERSGAGTTATHRPFRLDVSDRAEVDALAAAVACRYGALTILVNNAGVGLTGSFSDMTADEWNSIRSINLDGVVNCCAAFSAPMLAARRGQVVNVSSGLAFTATATESAYGATKAAVLQLSLCLRADWAAQGVGVTAVCPGFVNTPLAHATRFAGGQEDPLRRARLVERFSRAHPPEMVGAAIVQAIASDRALVPVGFESVLGWYAHRFTPIALQQMLARLGARGRHRAA